MRFGRYLVLESLLGDGFLTRARIDPLSAPRESYRDSARDRAVHEPIALYRFEDALLEDEWHEGSRPQVADDLRRRFDGFIACAPLLRGEPNLTDIFEVGKLDRHYFVAMELVQGVDSFALTRAPAPLAIVLFVAAEVARGLAALHARAIMHPELSPSDIVITNAGRTVLSGLFPRLLKGKPYWVAPERIRGEPCGARSDLFSVGLVLFRLLTGRNVVEAESDYALVVAMQGWSSPPRASSFRADVPADVDRILNRMLAAAPDDRYASAQEVERDLRAALEVISPGFGAADLAAYVARLALPTTFAMP